jgi:hypothetical protein
MGCACARIGTPSGGPRDEDPPIFMSSNPAAGAVNVTRTKMQLHFNEIVNVKDAFTNVVVSPVNPKSTPRVSSLGKTVTVEFDSLEKDVTYTVDFADAIQDNNESNILQGFTYTFSTGEAIDSMRIAGRVLAARDLEPQQSILVGVTRNLEDSAFTKLPLLRVAKTNDRGEFVIRGLAPGDYRVFALSDRDNDYKYSTPEEDIAFYPLTIAPSSEQVTVNDTVWNIETGDVKEVVSRDRTRYLPNDILLRSFNSEKRNQYLAKYERIDSTRVFLKFNTKSDSLPKIRVIGAADDDPSSIGTLEASARLDSLVYWLRPDLVHKDSLELAVNYPRTGDDGNMAAATDSLKFYFHRVVQKKKKGKEKNITAEDSIAAITFKWSLEGGNQEAFLPLNFNCPTPLAYLDTAKIHLEAYIDSAYQRAPITPRIMQRDSVSPRHFVLEYPWDYGAKYRLTIDSLAAMDIYGKTSMPFSGDLTVKKADDYCSMTFRISGMEQGIPAFVELLNGSDAVVRTAVVENGVAYFPFLSPSKYYARIIEDLNGNGIYDTGNYEEGLQPELCYYYPKVVNIKKNWDKDEAWDIFATAIDLQKPLAVKKNKPKTTKHSTSDMKQTDEEDEDESFDPTANPFDPNSKSRKRTNSY